MIRRTLAALLGVAFAVTALTACVRDVVNPAVDWLAGRAGIEFAEVVASTSTAWSSSGAVRGELEDGLDDEALERLVGEVLDYLAQNPSVGVRLGTERIDFLVSDDGRTMERAGVWREVADTPGMRAGLVTVDDDGTLVQARALRDAGRESYDALAATARATGASIRLGLFRDAAALEQNWRETYSSGDDPVASTLRWSAECDPDPAIAALALDLGTRDDVVGGWFALCEGFWIGLAEPEDFTTRVPALRAELDAVPAIAATGFPVTLQTSSVDTPWHVVAVAPTDPAVFGVLAVLEDPAAADSGLWELGADGSLVWREYGSPTSDLVARLAATPAAAALTRIEVTGDGSTVAGTIGELPALLDQADALDAAAESIGGVRLSAIDGAFTLVASSLDRPDTAEAAAALRASGLWVGRSFVVSHLNTSVEIRDGVPQPLEDYTDPEVISSFVEDWEATDPATTP